MANKLKCSIEQLAQFYQDWKNGAFGIIDFGQCVHIKFVKKGKLIPSLMNESNEFKAYSIARKQCKGVSHAS